MSAMWLERLREAPSKVARDEILLRELHRVSLSSSCFRCGRTNDPPVFQVRNLEEIDEQMRALADLAIPKER
jgi:hypothetical protein